MSHQSTITTGAEVGVIAALTAFIGHVMNALITSEPIIHVLAEYATLAAGCLSIYFLLKSKKPQV